MRYLNEKVRGLGCGGTGRVEKLEEGGPPQYCVDHCDHKDNGQVSKLRLVLPASPELCPREKPQQCADWTSHDLHSASCGSDGEDLLLVGKEESHAAE